MDNEESQLPQVIVPEATVVVEAPEQAALPNDKPQVVAATMYVQEEGSNVVVNKKHMRLIVALLCLLFVGLVVGLSGAFLMGGSDQRDVAAPVNIDNGVDVNVVDTNNEDKDDTEVEATAVPVPPSEGTTTINPPVAVFEPVCTEDSGFVQVAGRNMQRESDAVFRQLIRDSPHQIIRQKCPTCVESVSPRHLLPSSDASSGRFY